MKHQNSTWFTAQFMRPLFTTAFLLAITLVNAQSVSTYWKYMNPAPMGVHISDIAYVNNNVGYAACEQGVIGRTTDGGHTWTYDYIPSRTFLAAIEFPTETTGYVVGNNGFIAKTTDRGLTWTQLTSPVTVNINNIYFFNASTGFIVGDVSGGTATIYKTTDGGASWTSMAAGFPVQNKNIRAISFANANVGYASGAAGLVAKTTDGGTTWTNISLTTTNPVPPYPTTTYVQQNYPGLGVVDAQNVVISSQNNTFLIKSSDGGTTWTIKIAQQGTPISLSGSVQMLNIAVQGNKVAVSMASSLVATSFDKGDTWNVKRVFTGGNTNSFIQFAAVAFTPNGGVKLAGLYGTMADSLSGAAGWDTTYYKNIIYNPAIQKQAVAVSHLDKNNVIVGGVNGTVYRSNDGGASWVNRSIPEFTPPLYLPVALNDVKYVANDAAYMACSNGYVYRSFNAGDTWPDPYAFNIGRPAFALDFIDKNTGWVCGGNSTGAVVYRTTNGGVSWSIQSSVLTGATQLLGIDFINNTTGWVVGGLAKIFKTTDGGNTWTAQTPPAGITGTLNAVSFANADTGYAAGIGGKVIRTFDGGTTWTDISPVGITGSVNKILFVNAKCGILIAANGLSYKTIDAGATWTNFSTPTGDFLLGISVLAPYTSAISIPSNTDVDMMIVGGRALGGLSPTIMQARVFNNTNAVPSLPVITNVSDKCQGAATAKGKIMNPPPFTQIDITVDGVPVLYYPNDSTFFYFESGVTPGGSHTVRVRFINAGGNVFRDLSYLYFPVNPVQSVTIVSNDADNIICQGQSVTFTATPVNGGTTPSYQWKVNGVNVGTNSNTYSYVPSNNDLVTVVMTSNLSCVTTATASSNAVSIEVPFLSPAITYLYNVLRVTPVKPNATYQWYRDGQLIPGATGNTYIVTTFGTYTAQETFNTCSKHSNTLTIAKGEHDITVFPVPAITNNLYAKTGSPSELIRSVIMYDVNGRGVMSQQFTPSNMVQMNIMNLPPAVYFAKFSTSSGAVVTVKFVKQ